MGWRGQGESVLTLFMLISSSNLIKYKTLVREDLFGASDTTRCHPWLNASSYIHPWLNASSYIHPWLNASSYIWPPLFTPYGVITLPLDTAPFRYPSMLPSPRDPVVACHQTASPSRPIFSAIPEHGVDTQQPFHPATPPRRRSPRCPLYTPDVPRVAHADHAVLVRRGDPRSGFDG